MRFDILNVNSQEQNKRKNVKKLCKRKKKHANNEKE